MQSLFVGFFWLGWSGDAGNTPCHREGLQKQEIKGLFFSIQSLYLKIIILIIFRARQGGTPEWPSDHIFLEGVFDMLPASEEGTPAVPDGRQDQALDELAQGAPWPF